jgi:hypothetical protein
MAAGTSVDVSRARQAVSYFAVAQPEFWAAAAEHTLAALVPEAEFELGGRRYGVYAKDWRRYPPALYLERLLERTAGTAAAEEPAPPPIVALSLEDFGRAVHRALRNLDSPLALADSPLLYARLVAGRLGADPSPADRIAMLQRIVRDAAEELRAAPRAEKLHRALAATFLVGAPPQEEVAERLGLPFSTYRYQLTRALVLIVERLWVRELGAA